jgi:diguanylate cyclase (GGDEF)-like protein
MSDITDEPFEVAYAKLQQAYTADLPGRFADLRKDLAALAAGEEDAAASLRNRLHQLSGSGGSHGFPELSQIAREAEQWMITNQTWDSAAIERLDDAIDQLTTLLDSLPLPGSTGETDTKTPHTFGWQARVIGQHDELQDTVTEMLTMAGFRVTEHAELEDISAIPASVRPDILVIVGDATDFDTRATAAAWSSNRALRPRGVILIDIGKGHDQLGAVAAGVDAIFHPDQIQDDLAYYAKTLARIGVPPSTVLLVEDDLAQAQLVASALESSNIRVNHADTAARAQEILSQEIPDLILLDVELPDIDGFTLARLIRQDPKYNLLPIVFLTAQGSISSHIEALRAGADDFLTKPIDQSVHLLLQVVITRAERGRRIREMVHKDGLTGLLNHATLMAELQNAVEYAQRHDEKFAFLMIDIDHFKRVNDRHGHLVGDQVLRHVAHLFQGVARASDLIGRYGGEEFGMVLRRSGRDGAGSVARKLQAALRERPAATKDGETVPVEVSIGIAVYPGDGPTGTKLAHAADVALYQAKTSGRNRIEFAGHVPEAATPTNNPPPEA